MSPSSTTQPPVLPGPHELSFLPTSGAPGVAVRQTHTGVLVTLHGEVDCADGPALAAARGLLTSWQTHPVVDASAVTFIDAAGLRAVLSLTDGRSALLVLAPSPAFCQLLHLLHLVGSSIQAVPAGEGSSPSGPGVPSDLPAGSILVQDLATSAPVTAQMNPSAPPLTS